MQDDVLPQERRSFDMSSARFALATGITLLDGIALGVILPLLPFLVLHFGARPLVVTQLVAVYGIAAFMANPVMGRLSDRLGRGPLVVISLLGTLVSYIGILASWSLVGVFAFRIVGGLFAGRASVLRAMVTDTMPSQVQISRIGTLSAAGAIGAALGPMLGAFAAFSRPAQIAQYEFILYVGIALTIVALAAFLLVMIFAKAPAQPAAVAPLGGGGTPAISGMQLFRLLWLPFALIAVVAYGYGVIFSVTALLVRLRFDWGIGQTGLLVGSLAASVALVRIFLLQRLTKRFGLDRTLAVSLAVGAGSLLAVGLCTNSALFVAAFILCGCSLGLASLIPTAMVSIKAPLPARGYALGISNGINAIVMAISASINGFWFDFISPSSPHMAGALILAIGLSLLAERAFRARLASAQ